MREMAFDLIEFGAPERLLSHPVCRFEGRIPTATLQEHLDIFGSTLPNVLEVTLSMS